MRMKFLVELEVTKPTKELTAGERADVCTLLEKRAKFEGYSRGLAEIRTVCVSCEVVQDGRN